MFVGRKKELTFLENKYDSKKAEFIVMYGRRRIGKTELLREFSRGKQHIFYSAIETLDKNQLSLFSKALIKDTPVENYISSFESWEEALQYLAKRSESEKLLVIIDEFPYLSNGNPSIASIFQKIWDSQLLNRNIKLILCGSSMAFMEKELLSVKNPLYGRITGFYKLEELSFSEAQGMINQSSIEESIKYYGVLGGVPHYLKQIDANLTFKENLAQFALDRGAILFNEVEFLLRQELREVMTYYSIIQVIALGSTTLNEIEQKTDIDRTKINYYLNNLIELGIIEKEYSVTMPIKQKAKSRKGLYFLKDAYFRFYFTYMFPYMTELTDVGSDYLLTNVIEPDLNRFLGPVFEKIAIQYLNSLKQQNHLPFYYLHIGRWWEKGEEIDIVAFDQHQRLILSECKWTSSLVGISLLTKMQSLQVQVMPDSVETYYYLFSKSGFSKELKALAETNNHIMLINLNEMRFVE
ncbi:MAG TPA: ATP-binding protein [Clostridiales bacterium UBA8960]|jgi:AAA+ ATPase superfamily predicted ATPase|nr:ATP-binding protein [Clostridiales bacterium UBA8960]